MCGRKNCTDDIIRKANLRVKIYFVGSFCTLLLNFLAGYLIENIVTCKLLLLHNFLKFINKGIYTIAF